MKSPMSQLQELPVHLFTLILDFQYFLVLNTAVSNVTNNIEIIMFIPKISFDVDSISKKAFSRYSRKGEVKRSNRLLCWQSYLCTKTFNKILK